MNKPLRKLNTRHYTLNDSGADFLAAMIIKQACIDYWHECAPNRYKRPKGMTNLEFREYIFEEERKRERRRQELRDFFHSEWFGLLCQTEEFTGDDFIQQVEALRAAGQRIYFAEIGCEETAA